MLTQSIFFHSRFLLVFIFFCHFYCYSQILGKVVGVKDGDTIVVLVNDKDSFTIRLAEVDCPENGQPFGKNAKQFTSQEVFGKNIVFSQTDTDRYGRIIAKVYYGDDKYLSAEIIKHGFGWWYFHYSSDVKLKALQEIAKNKKIGLWSDKNCIAPWEWRKNKHREP